jgi:hypothetical protein
MIKARFGGRRGALAAAAAVAAAAASVSRREPIRVLVIIGGSGWCHLAACSVLLAPVWLVPWGAGEPHTKAAQCSIGYV